MVIKDLYKANYNRSIMHGYTNHGACMGERMVLSENPMGSLDNVLDNQIFKTSSNDSHGSSVEMYLNDEEDDGDSIVIPQTPSEETRTRIDNTRCPHPLLKEIGEDKI
ncbi:hypothetical protein Tco_0785950 [Tanacetum coccineum]